MPPGPATPRRAAGGRPRGRPKTRGSASASRVRKAASDAVASEPPPKKRRYIPGGPGGGGRFVDEDGVETPADKGGGATAPRQRTSAANRSNDTPSVFPRRERSTRIRTAVNRDKLDDMQYSSAAAVAAAVVQSEGYKPREERGWEEFHPNLDIEATFMLFHAHEVDGIVSKSVPPTPAVQASTSSLHGAGPGTPIKESNPAMLNALSNTPSGQGKPSLGMSPIDTPSRRRLGGRPTRESVSLYASRSFDLGQTPKTPQVLPINNQTPKERLDLKQPSYRKTDRIALFESKTFGQARYVDKSMMNVGYQESDNFIRPDRKLIKSVDANAEEDLDQSVLLKQQGDHAQHPAGNVGRVEYDMDEQDDMWLERMNAERKEAGLPSITREIFEITITKIEKEWHALEKRIPKPNPKPPQTHRPRSSSAAAVNGEPQAGEEQDSKCAICDDGDCENTNAIVFCDGCDLAVHQECYGVPFIPEGQWLCRKCQLIGRGIPTCIFCPNTDGAFKQTNSSKWAHLLCAMWIPEVSLGNHTFMEPVMEVEKVPRTRWKLACYICNQRMGACIQCSNKSCYQAFHVTCARRSRLYLKMKNSQGALAVLDGSLALKAFCDKHCPPDYAKENGVAQATKQAKRFYKRTMKGRQWADSAAAALRMAAMHKHANTERPPEESQQTGAEKSAVTWDKKGQPGKNVWKLPSGAPIIPLVVYDIVETSLQRFNVMRRKEFVAEACRYWTLKREARRGAALLKRLQLQMETFTSMELTRRNFATMGPSGKARLTRRVEFARTLLKDLEQLKVLSEDVVEREAQKLEAAELELEFVDSCYFPVYKMLAPIVERAFFLDKNIFKKGLGELQDKLDRRFYTTTLHFAHDFCQAISGGLNTSTTDQPSNETKPEIILASPAKNGNSEAKKRRQLAKRILKDVQPLLEAALRAEAEICQKPIDALLKRLGSMLEASLEERRPTITVSHDDGIALEADQDIKMADAPEEAQIIVADVDQSDGEVMVVGGIDDEDRMDVDDDASQKFDADASIEVANASENEGVDSGKTNGTLSSNASIAVAETDPDHNLPNGFNSKASGSPPSLPGAEFSQQPPTHLSIGDPLTPPQSNGSFGRNVDNPTNFLSEGGVPWYLKSFQLQGTSAVEEEWTGRQAVRSLSEELTDMDEETLEHLGFDVDDGDTITASPVNATAPEKPQRTPRNSNNTLQLPQAGSTSTRRTRSTPLNIRKGLRTSARSASARKQ
ncbi:peregrin [Rhypophila sp. PSN 637]